MCLNGFIRLRGCESGYTEPAGMYLDTLPSLSLENLSDMTDDKYLTAQNLVADKLNFAIEQIKPLLFDALGRHGYQAQSFTTIESGSQLQLVNATQPVGAPMRGLVVTNIYDKLSPNSQIFVEDVTLYTPFPNTSANAVIYFYDKDSNLLHSQLLDGHTAKINMSFAVSQLYILVSNTTFSTFHTSNDGTCRTCSDTIDTNKVLHFQGWNGTIYTHGNTFGITAKCSVKCDENAVICFFKEQLKMPLLYLTGAAVAEETAYSQRINYLTLNNREDALKFADKWRNDADVFLATAINTILTAMPNYDRVCMPCKSQFQSVNIKPA